MPEVPSPLYYDGRVHMIKNDGIVSCMDAETGKLLYRERLGAAGLYCSSPICADGRIYIASGTGVITVFKAGDTLQVLARNKLGEKVFATPAVGDNKLYVRTVRICTPLANDSDQSHQPTRAHWATHGTPPT